MTFEHAIERFGLRKGELRPTAAAFALFFLVLCSYYILRPIRDELSTRNPSQLQWLFTGTFLATLLTVPLFGGIVSHFSRRKVLPITFTFFASHLLLFYFLFERSQMSGWAAHAFFIWLSVYNLLVISAMWSLFNDVFRTEQAKRLYGLVAAGGSMGAIVGPLLTASAVKIVGAVNLMLLSGVLLASSIPLVFYLLRWSSIEKPGSVPEKNIGGSIWGGVRLTLSSEYLLKISLLLVVLTFLSTALYFQQASVLRSEVSTPEGRTQVLATIDFAVNVLALLLEFTAVGPLLVRFGPGPVLAGLLVVNAAGFIALGTSPMLITLALFQIFRRTTDYALVRPVREVFFTVVSREEKYKAKNFVDVVVFRGGDAVSGWAISALQGMGMAPPQIALLCAPLAIGAALLSRSLGNDETRKHASQPATLEAK